jgi:hypothetical protein
MHLMKLLSYALIGAIVAVTVLLSWNWTMNTYEGCVARGESKAYCMATIKWQNFKRFIGQ